MKIKFLIILLTSISFSYSQEDNITTHIAQLKTKIKASENSEKLKWMDSLSNLIAYSNAFKNDSIVKATIAYAKDLDSENTVIWQTANLLYFFNNIEASPEKSLAIILETKKWQAKVKDPKILSKYYYEVGNTYFYLSEYKNSLRFYDSCYNYARKDNNVKFSGLSMLGKGQVYTDMGDFGKASLTLQEGLKIFQKVNDTTRMVATRNSLTILYSKNGFYEEAMKEREEIIAIEKIRKSYDNLPVFYFNAAADYNKTGQQKERIKALKEAVKTARLSKFIGYYEPIMLAGLLTAYAENDSIPQAEKLATEINKNPKIITTGSFRAFYLEGIKSLAFAKKNYSEAIRLGEEYLEIKKQGNQYEEIQEAENFLYKVHNLLGNKNQALTHYENYNLIKDSIEAAKKTRVLSYYQTLYETEKRDLTIKAQKTNISLLDEKNKVKNQWLLFGGLGFLSLFGFVWVVRSRNFAKRKQKLQENFTRDILKSQEQERARIASELHDSVGQKLLMIKNSMILDERKSNDEIDLVGETIKEVREMSHNLHPFQFEKLGLVTSLKNMVVTFQKNSNVFYSEDLEITDGFLLKEKEIYVFRMLQECMTNVEKHAEATACNLSSEEEKRQVVFTLKDNGKGFETDPNNTSFEGLGMKTIKERALFIGAALEINSVPKKGTTVTIKIPKK